MKISPEGRKALMQREGVRLNAYKDWGGLPTIGVGHTSAAGLPVVTMGLTITAAECDAILSRDLVQFENAVVKALKRSIGQNAFDACTSLAFNIGPDAFARSTVVKRINAGDTMGAANAFLAWNKVKGRVVPGLAKRREQERKQFLTPDAPVVSLAVQTVAAQPQPEPLPKPDKPPGFWGRLFAAANRPGT